MPLRVAVQMDPIEGINIAGDSTFAIMLKAGVPKLVAGMLDAKIGEIRKQLDEAKALRAEAEKLRDEYARKAAAAETDMAAMRASAASAASRASR